MTDMTSPVVSVIVPVYKAEKYLHKCVDSILAQTFTDFEVLLIDDGSPDTSGDICDEYATKDKRIRVFHKKNAGVSSARNIGLDNAIGEWVAFVDADDYVEKNYLDSIFKVESDIDLIHFGFLKELPNNQVYCSYLFKYNKKIKREDLFLKNNFSSCSVSYFYRRRVIGDIRFNENLKYSEDREFIIKVTLQSVNYILLTPNTAYRYVYNPNSATNAKRMPNHYLDDLIGLYNIALYMESKCLVRVSYYTKMFIYKLFMKSFYIVMGSIGTKWKEVKVSSIEIINEINKSLNISDFESTIYCHMPSMVILKYNIYWSMRTFYHQYLKR